MTEDQARQRVIRSMCPVKVCRTCGEPSRRIVEGERFFTRPGIDLATQRQRVGAGGTYATGGRTEYVTVGWTDCGHDDWRPGVWLDPFAGAGEN